ncbi:hypothetical protein Sjap_004912 [Stephania japonica]|uniref:Uncharacterized protein n=1 Tax=Stephania japonica TaxID=461633 RepID=A0AAP0K4D8_9MAGN
MELKNLKLYMENRSIIPKNEKLKKRALLLHEENQALMIPSDERVMTYSNTLQESDCL